MQITTFHTSNRNNHLLHQVGDPFSLQVRKTAYDFPLEAVLPLQLNHEILVASVPLSVPVP